MLHCGTAGWAHADWHSTIYPRVPPRGFHPLEAYARILDLVEIGSTFEQMPRPERTRVWLRKVADNPRFRFTALLGRQFTHDRSDDRDAARAFREGLRPLLDAGKLGCLLMRFPWSFRFTPENRDLVISLRRLFPEYPLAAEMRHSSWLLDEALGVLTDHHIGFCNLDQPEGLRAMPPRAIRTATVGYVRFLGRSAADWVREDQSAGYLYTPQELADWRPRLDRLAAHTRETYVVMANVRKGQAVVNAMQLRKLLAVPAAAPPARQQKRTEPAASWMALSA
jgi:uncharacterized protein YecE (DUF72 family)